MDAYYERLSPWRRNHRRTSVRRFRRWARQTRRRRVGGRRLEAWCQSSAGGDRSLFARGCDGTDGQSTDAGQICRPFVARRRRTPPAWIDDAIWIAAALQKPGKCRHERAGLSEPCAFEHLLRRWSSRPRSGFGRRDRSAAADNLTEPARDVSCVIALLRGLSELLRAGDLRAICHRAEDRRADSRGTSRYDQFVADMKAGGILRAVRRQAGAVAADAAITRQWIETSREFVLRLDADLAAIRRDIFAPIARGPGCQDRRRSLRSAQWRPFGPDRAPSRTARGSFTSRRICGSTSPGTSLIERLNRAEPPVELKAVRAIARDGYGWTEFIDHAGRRCGRLRTIFPARRRLACAVSLLRGQRHASGKHDCGRRSSGADRSGNDPSGDRRGARRADPEAQAFDAAMEILANSVMMVGLLPAYGAVARQQGLCDRRDDRGLEFKNQNQVEQHQFRRDAAGEIEGNRRGQSEPAARRWPLRQIRRSYRRFHRGL